MGVRRKLTDQSTQIGSIRPSGQRISIRIITDTRLPGHHIYRYKYEVISKGSKYYRKVDSADSKILLRAGHSYIVTFNKNKYNPQILKLLREII